MTATVPHDGKNMTAQDLLTLASHQMASTVEAVAVPVPSCLGAYVARGAFPGDPVCVTLLAHIQAVGDTAAAASNYATNYTSAKFVPNVPYGICKTPLQYRQAYMGDYVCVSATHACQVAADNAATVGQSLSCAPPPLPHCGPQPNGSNSCM